MLHLILLCLVPYVLFKFLQWCYKDESVVRKPTPADFKVDPSTRAFLEKEYANDPDMLLHKLYIMELGQKMMASTPASQVQLMETHLGVRK